MRMSITPALAAALFVTPAVLPGCAAPDSNDSDVSCVNQEAQTRNVRRLAEIYSIAEPLVGVSEVSPEQARTIAHFKMAYDTCGKLVDVEYFHGETPKPIDENFSANRFVPATTTSVSAS